MGLYSNFIGIDIGKFTFIVGLHGSKKVEEYDNTSEGINRFLLNYNSRLQDGLCILETTGGYEMDLLLTLCHEGYAVHRANTRKVKHFIQSYGNGAKTDRLDAIALAHYGYERHTQLKTYEPISDELYALYELSRRRQDLQQMLVAEKNRLQGPVLRVTKTSIQSVIDLLSKQIEEVTQSINTLIEKSISLSRKKEVLQTIPGIGEITANNLIILLPELGQLNRREIASLSGLAPRAHDSGKYNGYRAIAHARCGVKPSLFMAAMAARNSNSSLKTFYEQLIGRGKKKKVALTALMRKIIVIANARVRELEVTEA